MSGCMNGCGHHSVGHIGILGVDKSGEEWYQVMLGGTPADGPTVGERVGRALSRHEIADGIERIEIGRASCRARVCQYVSISVVAGSLEKKVHNILQDR